jgi:hypothetical protein
MIVTVPTMTDKPIKFSRDFHAPGCDMMNQVNNTRAMDNDGIQKSNERRGTAG